MLSLPHNAGSTLISRGRVFVCKLLSTEEFVKFCKKIKLPVDRKRLLTFERLELFEPVFRVRKSGSKGSPFRIPLEDPDVWQKNEKAWDTTMIPHDHVAPSIEDESIEGYYSIFQTLRLHQVCSAMTLRIHLESFDEDSTDKHLQLRTKHDRQRYEEYTDDLISALKHQIGFRTIGLLCQHLSDRYYPQTQSDKRTFPVSPSFYTDQFIEVSDRNWSWEREIREWDPHEVEQLYGLTSQSLKQAHRVASSYQSNIDPMANWYELTQFVSSEWRSKLLGDALAAKTIREGAEMLGFLYRDLYGEELKHPNEVTRTIFVHLPEVEVRIDPRRFLEFVTNRFGVNPQIRLSLFVEGESERLAIDGIFSRYFGFHPGVLGIEIVDLTGVDQATGGKREKYLGMVRLIDYLHNRHTHTFLILDNENETQKLKARLPAKTSIHFHDRLVTNRNWVKIWNHSYEFDNFSRTEILRALEVMTNNEIEFSMQEITGVRDGKMNLKKLFSTRTSRGIDKPQLNRILLDGMFDPSSRKRIENRPIIQVLKRVIKMAAQDGLPDSNYSWESYQHAGRFGTKKAKESKKLE